MFRLPPRCADDNYAHRFGIVPTFCRGPVAERADLMQSPIHLCDNHYGIRRNLQVRFFPDWRPGDPPRVVSPNLSGRNKRDAA